MKVIAASEFPTNLLILRLNHSNMIDNQPPSTNHKHQLIFLFGFFPILGANWKFSLLGVQQLYYVELQEAEYF